MTNKVTLGGDRLGSGKDMKVELQEFNRTSVDLGFTWRSTMSAGTLVPFMKEIALPGDTHEINLNTEVLTHPTIAPLFGSYKVQLDVFSVPMGLYQAEMIQDALNIGLDMGKVKFPIIRLNGQGKTGKEQINPSTLLNHLDIRGLFGGGDIKTEHTRDFNGVPMLAYWDIFKSYYANKQEEKAYYIKTDLSTYLINDQSSWSKFRANPKEYKGLTNKTGIVESPNSQGLDLELEIILTNTLVNYEIIKSITERLTFGMGAMETIDSINPTNLWDFYDEVLLERTASNTVNVKCKGFNRYAVGSTKYQYYFHFNQKKLPNGDSEPTLKSFPLENIDKMRKRLIKNSNEGSHFVINEEEYEPLPPYTDIETWGTVDDDGFMVFGKQFGQELLAVKTYQSDLFNNWLNTEMINGDTGINELTKIDVTDGLKINDLILHRKLYDMLNNIAISGGSYDNWLNATYNQKRQKGINSPMYHGGLIKELTFDEVISNSATAEQPLGTLAGRGVLTNKHKGGYIKIKTDEPSYIIGIISLTPRVDYSQGNKWDTNLMTWDDFHKPILDGIGFQDLLTDQMDFRDTQIDVNNKIIFKSAGKQPAWINYQTNVNVVKGNFALEDQQMFMVLNRRYETNKSGITDLTTYIDPAKFNHVFAYTRRDAQNFWAQIKVDITARRKMSAKLIPNL